MVFQAQQLSGRVTESGTGKAVSYASVGLIKANRGTNARPDGRFEIDFPLILTNDSLIISCVGYKTVKLPVENNRHTYEVLLERNAPLLKEVVIRHYSKKITLPWSGKKSDILLYTGRVNSHTQAARLLEAPTAFSRLESVSVATSHIDLFSRSSKSRFRIHIYDYDSANNQPGFELCDSVIEVFGSGIVTAKLEKFQITIPHKRFFVAVQWLFIEENLEGRLFASLSDTLDYYRPGIRMIRIADKGNTWWLYHNQSWVRHDNDLAITATVSY